VKLPQTEKLSHSGWFFRIKIDEDRIVYKWLWGNEKVLPIVDIASFEHRDTSGAHIFVFYNKTGEELLNASIWFAPGKISKMLRAKGISESPEKSTLVSLKPFSSLGQTIFLNLIVVGLLLIGLILNLFSRLWAALSG